MYLCHSEILMPKDTKSLGNNKAPACESRGFVHKKKTTNVPIRPTVDRRHLLSYSRLFYLIYLLYFNGK